MPKASNHSSSKLNKLLYIGDSGTGKTTSLFSLVQAGYKLRIFDFDNLLAPLISVVRSKAPDKLD
jgi:GTPase SAR1 family protein